ARRRGRQVTEDERYFRFVLESEYDQCIALLKREAVGWRKRESRENWIARLSDVMQRVWASLFAPRGGEGETIVIRNVEVQLPTARSRGIAGDLVNRSEASDRYLRSHLAYNMLAFRWHLAPDAVRYRVSDAKALSSAAK